MQKNEINFICAQIQVLKENKMAEIGSYSDCNTSNSFFFVTRDKNLHVALKAFLM